MRIIKLGTLSPVKELEIEKTCSRCGCVFTCTSKDAHIFQQGIYVVYCPCCNRAINV